MRLEQEPCSPFSAKEIIVKVQYKYCPNLTIIDTPGLIAPAPGLKNRALQVVFSYGFQPIPWLISCFGFALFESGLLVLFLRFKHGLWKL